ncbi:hypothetical protein E2C01_058524 [Portunus trituberculatus]|jgi:hypothetical protein
MSIK